MKILPVTNAQNIVKTVKNKTKQSVNIKSVKNYSDYIKEYGLK